MTRRSKKRLASGGHPSSSAVSEADKSFQAVTTSRGRAPSQAPGGWYATLQRVCHTRAGWVVFVGAILVRLIHWAFVRANDPFYAMTLPETDMHTYWEWAKSIVQGDWLSRKQGVFYYGPLYPYWLAVWFKLFGPSYDVAHLWQVIIGALAPLAVWDISRRLWGACEGLAAGIIVALAAPILFYEQLLLMEGLLVAIHALFLWCCMRALSSSGRKSWLYAFAAGFLAGLACLGRGNFLLVAMAFIPSWFILTRLSEERIFSAFSHGSDLRRRPSSKLAAGPAAAVNIQSDRAQAGLTSMWGTNAETSEKESAMLDSGGETHLSVSKRAPWKLAMAYTASLCVVLGLSLARNGFVGGQWVLTTSNGPILFYIGNVSDSMGIFSYPESFFALEAKYGGDRSAVPWSRELMVNIAAHPGQFLKNLARKVAIFFSAYEVADNASLYLLGKFSPLVRFNPVGWQLIVALGCVGLWLTRRRWREQFILYLYSAAFALSIIAVFIVGRYRLEFLLPMAVWGGATIGAVLHSLAQARWSRVATIAAAVIVVALALDKRWSPAIAYNSPPAVAGVRPIRSNDFVLLARCFVEANRPTKAKDVLAEGFQQYPWDPTLAKSLALMLQRDNQLVSAISVLRRYLSFCPGDLDAACDLARLLFRNGSAQEARGVLEAILRIDPAKTCAQKLLAQLRGVEP